MTRGIEDMLNLPHLEDLLKDNGMESDDNTEENDRRLAEALAIAEQAEQRLAMTTGADHALAMDDLYTEIKKHAQDLMDLGYNIDHARARGIFEIASSMFKNAIDAKNSKRDAELKAMKLALDEKRLELDRIRVKFETGMGSTGDGEIREAVIVEDRNVLLKQLRDQMNRDKKPKDQ